MVVSLCTWINNHFQLSEGTTHNTALLAVEKLGKRGESKSLGKKRTKLLTQGDVFMAKATNSELNLKSNQLPLGMNLVFVFSVSHIDIIFPLDISITVNVKNNLKSKTQRVVLNLSKLSGTDKYWPFKLGLLKSTLEKSVY